MEVFTLLFINSVFIGSTKAFSYSEEGSREAAEYLLEGLNASANPCENFMKFACGKWLEGAGKTFGGEIAAYSSGVYDRLKEAIDSINVHHKATPKFKVSVSTFYNQCLEDTKEENKEETMIELFKSLSNMLGVPPILATNKNASEKIVKENLWHFLGSVQRNLPVSAVFFRADPLLLESECQGNFAALKLVPVNELHDPLCAKDVVKHTEMLSTLLNVKINKSEMTHKIQQMLKFEEELFQLYNTTDVTEEASENLEGSKEDESESEDEEGEQDANLEDAINVNELKTSTPNISWSNYFEGLFSMTQRSSLSADKEIFIIKDKDYFNDLNELFHKHEMETVFNYVFYRAMRTMHALFLEGNDEQATKESCLEQMKKIFKPALAKILFDYYDWDHVTWSHDIQLIAETVFSSLKFLISTSDWLDYDDKLALIAKINYIKFYSGVPYWFNNNTEIDMRTISLKPDESQMQTFFRLLQGNYDSQLDYVIGLRDSNDEAEPDLEVNAFYSAMHIYMLLGYSLPPWYSPSYPLAFKYGLMGFTIGHELMHAFDSNHIEEAPPKWTNRWLQADTLKSFKKKVDCVVKQYSSYCYRQQKVCVNGRKTISENIADNDGLKIAYMAYKFALQTIGDEPPMHGLFDYSGEQIFFLTFARTQCTNNVNVASLINMDDPHAPDAARIDVPLKNFPLFAKVFNCPIGSFYAPMKTCSIWGSFYSERK